MNLHLLTNPYVIGYVILIWLLWRAGSVLQRMHEENVQRRNKPFESGEPAATKGQAGVLATNQDGAAIGEESQPEKARSMEQRGEIDWPYLVRADWDADAGVWVARSDEVQGLVTEAPTVEALVAKLEDIVPEVLEANSCLPTDGKVAIELVARRLFIAP